MAKKRIRIDMEDSEGARYDIKLEGNVTREKVLKIFEMMDLMNIEEEHEITNMYCTTNGVCWPYHKNYFGWGANGLTNKYIFFSAAITVY